MRAKLLVVVLTVVAPTAFAAPRNPEPRLPSCLLPCTCGSQMLAACLSFILLSGFNEIINEKLGSIKDAIILQKPIEIKAYQDGVMDMYIQMTDVEILGVEDFTTTNSTLDCFPIENKTFNIDITSPKVTLNANHYFINGSMVDHIELVGEGPGMISVDEMNIKLKGNVSMTLQNFSLVFHEAVLDLEMWRWTVDLENLMPGTDLGTVFNEFFSMCGPEIFDTVENNINSSGKLLTFLNGLFPPDSCEESEMWDADSFIDGLLSLITLSHQEN